MIDKIVAEALLGVGFFQADNDTLPDDRTRWGNAERSIPDDLEASSDRNVAHLRTALRVAQLVESLKHLYHQLAELESNMHEDTMVSRKIIHHRIQQKQAQLAEILGPDNTENAA